MKVSFSAIQYWHDNFLRDVDVKGGLISIDDKHNMKAKMTKKKVSEYIFIIRDKKTLGTVSFPGVRSKDARRIHSNNDIVNLKYKRNRIR